jgi:DNA-binding transcriptional LysR family regulator
MPEWKSPEVPVHALYQRSRYMAPRVRVLLDFLVERFSNAASDLDPFLRSG